MQMEAMIRKWTPEFLLIATGAPHLYALSKVYD
jgi:hypothetical protein